MASLTGTIDTAPDAAAVVLDRIRSLSPEERLRKGCAMSRRGRRFAIETLRSKHSNATEEEIRLRFLELAYGPELAADVRCWLAERRG